MPLQPSRRRRSALYLPASNARALAKARTLPCDVVILDLEDAVAPEAKASARGAVLAALKEGGFGDREVVVRVNALDGRWGADDVAALTTASVAPHAVLAPKVSSPAAVADYAARLPPGSALWVMIETAAALFALEPIAAMAHTKPLAAFVIGANDLALETRWRAGVDRAPFAAALAMSVAAAHAHGLVALDAVFNDLDDAQGFEAECAQGVAFGFDGKTLIHPSQIAAANRAFSPTEAEVAHARAVVAAFADPANAGRGALRVEGRMVEALHLQQAQQILVSIG